MSNEIKYCKKCGTQYTVGEEFCGNCGNKLEGFEKPAETVTPPVTEPTQPVVAAPEAKPVVAQKPKKKNTALIIIIVVAALLIAIIGSCVLLGMGSSTKYYVNEYFLSEDTNVIKYEKNYDNVNWGRFQKDQDALTGKCVELQAETVYAETEEEFESQVKLLKDKLDVLEVPYALGYSGERAHQVSIQIEGEKIGLPILALLNINSSFNNTIVSGLGDFRANGVDKLNYTLGADGKYVISVGVPELYKTDFEEYCAQNVGKTLYLKLGDITFTSTEITENMNSDTVDFYGLCFVGKEPDESKYEKVLELADYVVNKNYEGTNGNTSFSLEIEGEALYGIPYITEMDQGIMEMVTAKYPDVKMVRRDIENELSFYFEDSNKEVLTTEDYLGKVVDIYQMCGFDEGAYSYVYFGWSSKANTGYIDSMYFSKWDGRMICYPSERIEYDVYMNDFLKSHLKDAN